MFTVWRDGFDYHPLFRKLWVRRFYSHAPTLRIGNRSVSATQPAVRLDTSPVPSGPSGTRDSENGERKYQKFFHETENEIRAISDGKRTEVKVFTL
jgi:hypothetical protein